MLPKGDACEDRGGHGRFGLAGAGCEGDDVGMVAALKGRGNGPARGAGRNVEREAALGLDHRQQFAGERGGLGFVVVVNGEACERR